MSNTPAEKYYFEYIIVKIYNNDADCEFCSNAAVENS